MIDITLLGASALIPLPERAETAAQLVCRGHSILFDCGEGTQTAMRKAGIASMHLVLTFMAMCSVVIILFRHEIASVFTQEEDVIDLAAILLIMTGIYQMADGLQTVIIGALRGMKNVITPMVVAFICYIVVTISVSYFCGIYLGWGAAGIWFAYIIELYLASLLLIIRFRKDVRKFLAIKS